MIIIGVFCSYNDAMSIGKCDSLTTCLGNALTQTITTGKSAQYVDVLPSSSLFSYTNQLSVEFWFKPQKQAGKIQYIAGIWGPAEDANDVWVIYIDGTDNLCFEINNPGTNQKSLDNTIAKTPISGNYDKWIHGCFVFDGLSNTAFIYIDGSLQYAATNNLFPISFLKKPERSDLSLQIGGANAVSNDPNTYRTFLGQIDEFRIWHKVLTPSEIFCGKDLSFEGSEKDLILYHRYNQNQNIFDICDATNKGNNGIARSGAACKVSNRRFFQTIFIEPKITQILDTLKCESKKEWTFKVRDTSSCKKTIFIRVDGIGKEYFKVNPARFNNTNQNEEYEFTLTFEGNLIGNIAPNLQIYSANRCRDFLNIPIKLTRASELSYTKDSLGFDLLKALCIQSPYHDSVITICNTTNTTSNPKNITINSITSSIPAIFQVISPSAPVDISPGACQKITVRFNSKDTTNLYKGVLTIKSTDGCNPEVKIDLVGQVQEVIGIFKTDGKTRLPLSNFGTVCVDFASDAVQYVWSNLLTNEDIFVDTIIYPQGFTGVKYRYPVTLEFKTGYMPDYFRFFPNRKGPFNDSIIFVVRSGGCTIRKPVYVKGTGYESELEFILPNIDFGSIPVGQTVTLDVEVINKSNDPLQVSFYLKDGSGFFLNGARSINIPANGKGKVPLTFNPSQSKLYLDEICFFENRCYKSGCIQVKGIGYAERFSFQPEILNLDGVIGCEKKTGKVRVVNNTAQTQTLTNFVFTDTSTKFTIINPGSLPTSITLKSGEFFEFEIEYSPNQINVDRVDRAYIYFKSEDGIIWNLKILGTSQSPKIFVTQETTYGQLEVGEKRVRTIIVENISPYDVTVDSLFVGSDFKILYPLNLKNRLLKPRDSIQVQVEFAPTLEKYYDDIIKVFSSQPCMLNFTGNLSGRGLIIPLDIPISVISFGFIKPCDCAERKIQLINESRVFDMKIDSVYINGDSIAVPTPQLFDWNSFVLGNTKNSTPYNIKPSSRDTITVKYCPSGNFNRDSIDHSARIWVKASGNGWTRLYNVYLSGKMEIPFEAEKKILQFNPTRVDTFSVPNFTELKIPTIEYNLNQETVVIDSITFMPDERVFTASINGSTKFPVMLKSKDSLNIKVDFKPRAVREYKAKMVIHYSKPCLDKDTTVLVSGSGYAPAFGLSFNFENIRQLPDTLKFISCDTLTIPVYTSRQFPANVVDIKMRIGYDTTKLSYVGADSPYLKDTCKPHIPAISHKYSAFGGSEFLLKNFCTVDSTRPLLLAKFISKTGKRDIFDISLDSVNFDTEEVILFNIVAANDYGKVVILQPEIEIQDGIDFDSVQVLDCKSSTITVRNTGDIPVSIDNLIKLSNDFKVKSYTPNSGTLINVGDSCLVEIEFCPRKSGDVASSAFVESFFPCPVNDSCYIQGIGYAPELSVKIDISLNFDTPDTPDTLGFAIGDTVDVTLYTENDLSAVRNNILYNIMDLDFNVSFNYNPFVLKLISTVTRIPAVMKTNYAPGSIKLSYSNVNALKRGAIADLKFLAMVPDSVLSIFEVQADNFQTDSLLFLDLKTFPILGYCKSDGKCSLTYLKFTDNIHSLSQNFPNPWSDYTDIKFSIMEKVPVFIDIYSYTGEKVSTLLEGNEILSPGNYALRLYSGELSPGIYFYTIRAGIFSETKKMILVK
jgi:hypothetical protein